MKILTSLLAFFFAGSFATMAEKLEIVDATNGKLVAMAQAGDVFEIEGKQYRLRGPKAQKMESELRRIVIPRVDFQETPLEEGVEYLTQKAIELGGPNVELNFRTDIDYTVSVAEPGSKRLRRYIPSLRMRNVSLFEVLSAMSESCDFWIDYTEECIVLRDGRIQEKEAKK